MFAFFYIICTAYLLMRQLFSQVKRSVYAAGINSHSSTQGAALCKNTNQITV
jgi:hypothetical protein